jgi:hypothetical protein
MGIVIFVLGSFSTLSASERQNDSSSFSLVVLHDFPMQFLGFRKSAKSDYWFCHVCLSIRMEQLGSHWKDFDKIACLSFFFSEICQENPTCVNI